MNAQLEKTDQLTRLVDMKYVDPTSLRESLHCLDEIGSRAKVLAGGQSLLPMINSRSVSPEVLIDINHVKEFDFIANDKSGFRVGAIIRQRELEKFPGLAKINPLLSEAIPLIGHFQLRNRGTVCGSLAQADSAAELPAVALTLSATFTIQSLNSLRVVAAQDFFLGPRETCLQPNELLTQVKFPPWNYNEGWAIEEFSWRQGDFALAGVVVLITPDIDQKTCLIVRVIVFGVGKAPQRVQRIEEQLSGQPISLSLLDSLQILVQSSIEIEDSLHASVEYRKHLVGILIKKALIHAAIRAGLPVKG